MFHRVLADCFPYEDLPTLYACVRVECFYYETLLNARECVWKHRWDGEALPLVPFCPSCRERLTEYEDPDGSTTTI